MAETTAISWADKTFNPWVGCTKVSPGCDHCYAEGWAKRSGRDVWGAGKARQHTAPAYWREPLKWNAQAESTGIRPRVFPSLCDPFDAEVPREWKLEFDGLRFKTQSLDWLLLTKRPNRIQGWDFDWFGTSVESKDQLWRIDALRENGEGARVRFLSLEPLIGDLGALNLTGIDWVITGGESGPNRRPMELEWAQDIQRQCEAAGVAFWFKQISDQRPGQGEDALGRVYHELPKVAA